STTTSCYTLSLHDALPIFTRIAHAAGAGRAARHASGRSVGRLLREGEEAGDGVPVASGHRGPGGLRQDRRREPRAADAVGVGDVDRKSTRLNSSHVKISYA